MTAITAPEDTNAPGTARNDAAADAITPFAAAADTITGTNGSEGIMGTAGNDSIAALGGNDLLNVFVGSGADTIDGGSGTDIAIIQGGIDADTVAIGANSAHAITVSVDGAAKSILTHVETLFIVPWDGADTISVGDLSGAGVSEVDISLQGFSSLIDQTVDKVNLTLSSVGTQVEVQNDTTAPNGDAVNIFTTTSLGEARFFHIDTMDAGDQVNLQLGGGNDVFLMDGALNRGAFNVDGGAGDDLLRGSTGTETLQGGTGNDTLQEFGGADSLNGGGGNDLINWQFQTFDATGPITTVNGGAGTDTLHVANLDDGEGGWAVSLGASGGGHASLGLMQSEAVFGGSIVFESVGFDLTGVENIQLVGSNSTGAFPSGTSPNDFFNVGDLTGAGIKSVDIDLGHDPTFPSAPDRATDFVQIAGTASADHVVVTLNNSDLTVTGLPAVFTIHNVGQGVSPADFLDLNTGAGNDIIDLSQITFGLLNHVIHGDAGNDTITDTGESAGFSSLQAELNGDDGNDVIHGGLSTSVIYGGVGNDTLSGAAGHSSFYFFNDADSGSDVITDFHTHQAVGGVGDRIRIQGDNDFSFSDLLNHGHLVQSGADVLITDGSHTIVTLQNIQLSSLSAGDFVF